MGMRPLIDFLPKVPGFRPHSTEGVHQRFKILIQDAKGSETSPKTETAWKRISKIWITWIGSHPILQKSLENYDNSADFENGNIIPPNTSLDIGCFTYLAEVSQLPHSLIQRYYEFGYFLQDSNIEFIIKNIEVKQALDNVLKRVSAIEKKYENLENQLSVFETLPNQVERLSQAVNAINLQLDMTLTTLDLGEFKQQVEELEKTLSDKVEILSQKIADMPLKSALDNLKQRANKLEKELAEQGELLFDELEQHHTTAPSNENIGYVIRTGLYTSQIEFAKTPKILCLKEELISHLTCHLKAAAGLKKDSAEKLAKEILASLAAGEFIVFSGSLAFNIAQVCTQALAAKQAPTVIHIPIGLLNGQEFGDYLWRAIKKAKMSGHVCAIIIEGINRSALESYAQTLRQMITQRLLGQTDLAPHVIFFGTLVEGVATLPVPIELCELGPIFNTDVLEWRSQLNTTAYEGGVIPTQNWQSWKTTDDNALENERLIDNPIFYPSQLWQLCVRQAYCHLVDIFEDSEESILNSLAFGWFIPRAVATEQDWMEIKEWLLEHVSSKDTHETRIEKLLRLHLKKE